MQKAQRVWFRQSIWTTPVPHCPRPRNNNQGWRSRKFLERTDNVVFTRFGFPSGWSFSSSTHRGRHKRRYYVCICTHTHLHYVIGYLLLCSFMSLVKVELIILAPIKFNSEWLICNISPKLKVKETGLSYCWPYKYYWVSTSLTKL